MDERLIMGIIANKDDDLKFKKHQIELFFSVHTDPKERAEYLKSAYHDRYTEVILDGGVRCGYKPQEDGLHKCKRLGAKANISLMPTIFRGWNLNCRLTKWICIITK